MYNDRVLQNIVQTGNNTLNLFQRPSPVVLNPQVVPPNSVGHSQGPKSVYVSASMDGIKVHGIDRMASTPCNLGGSQLQPQASVSGISTATVSNPPMYSKGRVRVHPLMHHSGSFPKPSESERDRENTPNESVCVKFDTFPTTKWNVYICSSLIMNHVPSGTSRNASTVPPLSPNGLSPLPGTPIMIMKQIHRTGRERAASSRRPTRTAARRRRPSGHPPTPTSPRPRPTGTATTSAPSPRLAAAMASSPDSATACFSKCAQCTDRRVFASSPRSSLCAAWPRR